VGRYNVGRRKTDGKDIRVESISEFWSKAKVESLNGAKFHLHSYGMMCYDDLPSEVREALRNSKDDHDPTTIWEFIKHNNWSAETALDWIKELEKK
jgi:hypothetical protein